MSSRRKRGKSLPLCAESCAGDGGLVSPSRAAGGAKAASRRAEDAFALLGESMEQKPTALRWRLRRRGRDGFASSAQRVWQRCLRRTPTLIGCVCLFRTAGRAKGRKTIIRPRGASRGAEPRLSGGDTCKAEAPGRFLCGHFVCTLLQSALAGRAVLAGDASCRTDLTQWKSPFQSAPLPRAAARLRSAHRPDQQFPSAPLLRAAAN